MDHSAVFSRLMDEYGNMEQGKKMDRSTSKRDTAVGSDGLNDKMVGDDLMQIEERNTGAVTWDIYSKYLQFAGGIFWAPTIFLLLVLSQAAQGDRYSYDICGVRILILGRSCK
jgi:ATP-binding cassette subfamily C (CFTR/MRP) protein 1